jgi:hypothetical protein
LIDFLCSSLRTQTFIDFSINAVILDLPEWPNSIDILFERLFEDAVVKPGIIVPEACHWV